MISFLLSVLWNTIFRSNENLTWLSEIGQDAFCFFSNYDFWKRRVFILSLDTKNLCLHFAMEKRKSKTKYLC